MARDVDIASGPAKIHRGRSPLLLSLLGLLVGFYGLIVYAHWEAARRPVPGFILFDNPNGPPNFDAGHAVGAMPFTIEASHLTEGSQGFLTVLAVNDWSVRDRGPPDGTLVLEQVERHIDAAIGAKNRYHLRDEAGRDFWVEVTTEWPSADGVPDLLLYGIGYQAVAFLYLGLGLLVWIRRPEDHAATAFLGLGLVAAFQLALPPVPGVLGRILNLLAGSTIPFYAPVALRLAFRFTGYHGTSGLRRLQNGAWWAAGLMFVYHMVSFELWSRRLLSDFLLQSGLTFTGVLLIGAIVMFLYVTWRAARPDNPPALRRRARLFAFAVVVSFGSPSVQFLVFSILGRFPTTFIIPNLICLAVFPVIIAYTILRYHLFDIRIFLRRSVLFTLFSLVVSLLYIGGTLLALEVIGPRAESPVFRWLSMAVVLIAFGLAQLELLERVDRWINRRKYRYSEAIDTTSEALARTRTLEGILTTLGAGLIGAMKLSRAYLVLRDGPGQLRTWVLDNQPDPETGVCPPTLPEVFELSKFLPLARVLDEGRFLSAGDPSMVSALQASEPKQESVFASYRLEAIVPLGGLGLHGQGPPEGALLLGPKQNGHPFDHDDLRLVRALANQLTVAVDNARAFERIEELKSSLERQVEARTKDLQEALADLQEAEAQLIETEKQAMLGRLVAGIAHELNTPLGALRSSTDTIRRLIQRVEDGLEAGTPGRRRLEKQLGSAKDLTHVLDRSQGRIAGLVDSLKSFVLLDEAEKQNMDLREGIDSAIALLEGNMGPNVRVLRDYPGRVPEVTGSPQRLNQVFFHILQNAVQALGDAGEIQVSIRVEPKTVEIRFTDDGPGIPREDQAHLFDFGFTKKNGRMAMKLGLPSSQRIVQELGGTLSLDSEEGVGTTVRIRLPATGEAVSRVDLPVVSR